MDRNTRWIRASSALARFERWLIPMAQGLGRLDVRLIAEDDRFLDLGEIDRASDAEILRFDEQRTLSYLWVLGAYELVRTFHQRMLRGLDDVGIEQEAEVGNLKRLFNRLRVPLAKLEPAGSHSDTDSPIAYPALRIPHGTAWQVSEQTFITRLELSESLLNLLERLREQDPSLPDSPLPG